MPFGPWPGSGGGGGGGGGSGAPAIIGPFSSISGNAGLATTLYMLQDADLGGASSVPLQYPTSARTILGLRLGAVTGTAANPPTATLMKNGVATAMTCTLGAGAVAGANVSDFAHPITFADGDTFDIRITQPIAPEGTAEFTAVLEASSAGAAVSFADAGQRVGVAVAAVSLQAARADHGHATLNAATSAAMTALPVAGMLDGTPCYLPSRDAVFRIQTSALAVNTYDVLASADGARRWLRDGRVSLLNAAVTGWFIDTGAGNDDDTGLAGHPLKTYSELAWRLWNARLPANVLVSVTGNQQAADLAVFTCRGQGSTTFTIEGQLGAAIFNSTITAVPTVVGAGPSATENTITDAAVPGGSFTASGAMANGVLGNRTAGGDSFFWFARDNGATTAEISVPTAALANGNAYGAFNLPTITQLRFEETRFNSVVLRQLQATSQTFTDLALRFERCWFTTCTLPDVVYANCAFQGSQAFTVLATGRNGNFSTGGMFRGAASSSVIGSGIQYVISGKLTLQNAGLTAQGGLLANAIDIIVNDWAGATGALTATFGGKFIWSTGGAIVGVRNGAASPVVAAIQQGVVAHVANPLLVAGSTANGTPFTVNGTGAITIAQENAAVGALNVQGNGIFPTT
jgi:hypothetical protein